MFSGDFVNKVNKGFTFIAIINIVVGVSLISGCGGKIDSDVGATQSTVKAIDVSNLTNSAVTYSHTTNNIPNDERIPICGYTPLLNE